MKLKKCKECGQLIGKDRKTDKYWCPNCKEIREEFDGRLRIVVLGKNAGKKKGKRNFIVCMARELRGLGHNVIELSNDVLYNSVPQYDFENCFHNKKPINIKFIQYKYDPDFIYVEQMYMRMDISEITCPVIYQHREYTHFPDIVDPDILLATYHWRLRIFELYHPWEYHNIPYKDYNYCAVNDDECKPVEKKTQEGITHIGLMIPMIQFRLANGPFGDMVMEDQEVFWEKCTASGYINTIPVGLLPDEFLDMVGRCEALLYDAGRFGGISRRLFEMMALKTIPIIRIHSNMQLQLYKEIGLTEEICFFVQTVEDIGKIKFTEEERKTMADKGYEWVIKNHTYKVRAKELVEKYEEFKSGVKKQMKWMGYALKKLVQIEDGGLTVEDN